MFQESEQSVQEEETSFKPVLGDAVKPVSRDVITADDVSVDSSKKVVGTESTEEDPYLTHYMPQSEHSDFVQVRQIDRKQMHGYIDNSY